MTDPDPRLAAAEATFRQNDLAEAEKLSSAVLADDPSTDAAYLLLGLIAFQQDRYDAALIQLEKAALTMVGDYRLELALAQCKQALNRAEDAIPHMRCARARQPFKHDVRLALGQLLLSAHRPAETLVEMDALLSVSPDHIEALIQKGVALLNLHHYADAVVSLQRATTLAPHSAAAWFHLGQALRQSIRTAEAIAAFKEAVRLSPEDGALHAALGDALIGSGDDRAGLNALREAERLLPDSLPIVTRLGEAEQLFGFNHLAIPTYRRALVLHRRIPGSESPYRLLGNALWRTGEREEALQVMREGIAASPWMKGVPTILHKKDILRVACWSGMGFSNLPTDYILDPDHQAVETVFLVDDVPYDAALLSQAFDIVFNSISDADAGPDAIRIAAQLAPDMCIPVLNKPTEVLKTLRHHTRAALSGIPGLTLPRTERHPRKAAIAHPAWLNDFPYPALVRPAGGHLGQGMVRVDDAAALVAAAQKMDADDLYLIAFHDFHSPDGLYRKLRLVFVDGQVYPVHLSIGDHWLNHYLRTRTASDQTLLNEELAFLEDPKAYLGPVLYAAAEEIPERIGLDFFGLDGAIDPDGNLLIFECNATMRVGYRDNRGAHETKRKAAAAVKDAVQALLCKAAGHV